MTLHSTLPVVLVLVTLIPGGLWRQRSHATTTQALGGQGQGRQEPNKPRQNEAAHLSPGAHSLAFDVRRRDHRATARYVLEITHPSGDVTTHDLRKPKRRRGSIVVPLPVLAPGKYQLIVVAEGPGGKSRSLPFDVRMPQRERHSGAAVQRTGGYPPVAGRIVESFCMPPGATLR